jgi:phage terminase large subunit
MQRTLSLERMERARPPSREEEAPRSRLVHLPYAAFKDHPVEFAKEILGVATLWDRQEEILRAAAKFKKNACRSGHKIGKSFDAAILSSWWMATRPRAKVIQTSSSFENVETILWPELRKLHRESLRPLGGHLLSTARGGWKFEDGRICFGVSTDDPTRAAGKSGDQILYIADEASGIEDDIFEAIEGNLAGGASIFMFGNPTHQSGQFFRAFTDESNVWNPIHVSSEESPNVVARRDVIPGLCTYDWVEERKRVWGENSATYQIRVRGNFADKASNVVIGLAVVDAARKRHATTQADGDLEIGVDVARFGDDDSVIYPRRGYKALEPDVINGMDTVEIAGRARKRALQERRGDERPKIKVDVIGIGAGVADLLRRFDDVEVIDINVSERADDPDEFPNLRSQLWFGMGDWLKEGGAIPPSDKEIGAELTAPRYGFDARGRRQVEPKPDIKKRLKRSPDHAEALMLSLAKGEADDDVGGTIKVSRRG